MKNFTLIVIILTLVLIATACDFTDNNDDVQATPTEEPQVTVEQNDWWKITTIDYGYTWETTVESIQTGQNWTIPIYALSSLDNSTENVLVVTGKKNDGSFEWETRYFSVDGTQLLGPGNNTHRIVWNDDEVYGLDWETEERVEFEEVN